MDMSKAALPPINAPISERDRQHPRFLEYMRYRNGMIRLMVNCGSFESWLRGTLETEDTSDVVFKTKPGATLAHGWYKHKFSYSKKGGRELTARIGPFKTENEAKAA